MSRNTPVQPNNAWYWESVKIIRETILASQKLGHTTKQIIDAILLAYPYGERAMWPYKNWLIARRHMLCEYGLLPPGILEKMRAERRLSTAEIAANPLFKVVDAKVNGIQLTLIDEAADA